MFPWSCHYLTNIHYHLSVCLCLSLSLLSLSLFFPGANFVTRKISRSVAKVHLGQLESISLGNLDSKRDWGHAKDYVEVRLVETLLHRHTNTQQQHYGGNVFQDHLRPKYVICMKPLVIACQNRNQREGGNERRERPQTALHFPTTHPCPKNPETEHHCSPNGTGLRPKVVPSVENRVPFGM